MLLHNAPQDQAVLSNVGEIGEFRIRNSAKAFSILSSGLYANKIRAIVRELSCNAVDSHAAAGRKDVPFEVHLPTTLEPYFAIRDFGTGLSHYQVTQIYTTYFESTKTASNEFIGALGLGSKSPFSYTDNFTVTAIQNGRKGIYSAFINGDGVPSIALMMEETTDEPSGVEVKFGVNDRWDFDKFCEEARSVYTYFQLRPNVTGVSDFGFRDIEYLDKDIIPGVHSVDDRYGRSTAVMGNIAYPIEIPNAESNLGSLRKLLECGLELHFEIGELDFQASREGLSYIPETVASIKAKLETLNASLAGKLATEADAIANLWDRTAFLIGKRDHDLWSAAVEKYVVDTKFPLMEVNKGGYKRVSAKIFRLSEESLRTDYNIVIRAFNKNRGNKGTSTVGTYNEWINKGPNQSAVKTWEFAVNVVTNFVVNDTKVGALERAKYHWNNLPVWTADLPYSNTVFVIEAFEKTKPIKSAEFLQSLMNPPRVALASSLLQKARAANSGGKNVTIMRLESKGYGGYYAQKDLVWRDAGKVDSFSSTETYYYLPLSGFQIQSKSGISFDIKTFSNDLKSAGVRGFDVQVHGVRKGDIDYIKTQPNWINIEDYITDTLLNLTASDLTNMVISELDNYKILYYNSNIADNVTNPNSPFLAVTEKFKDAKAISFNSHSFNRLCSRYAKVVDLEKLKAELQKECSAVCNRYSVLRMIDTHRMNSEAVAEYINLVDTQKGI